LKEKALDRIKRRNRFGRGCGPVVWQITDDERPDQLWGLPSLLFNWYRGFYPGRKADHSPPSGSEVKNKRSYTSTPPVQLHRMQWHTFTFYVMLSTAY
jgi:hypothetical protein